jgi:hypothetical protein
MQQRLMQLSTEDRTKLINGISTEAAYVLKKILPDSPLVEMLISVKTKFSNF